jgi:hypothetical protein
MLPPIKPIPALIVKVVAVGTRIRPCRHRGKAEARNNRCEITARATAATVPAKIAAQLTADNHNSSSTIGFREGEKRQKRRCLWHRRSLGRKRPRKQSAEARLRAQLGASQVQHARGFAAMQHFMSDPSEACCGSATAVVRERARSSPPISWCKRAVQRSPKPAGTIGFR